MINWFVTATFVTCIGKIIMLDPVIAAPKPRWLCCRWHSFGTAWYMLHPMKLNPVISYLRTTKHRNWSRDPTYAMFTHQIWTKLWVSHLYLDVIPCRGIFARTSFCGFLCLCVNFTPWCSSCEIDFWVDYKFLNELSGEQNYQNR